MKQLVYLILVIVAVCAQQFGDPPNDNPQYGNNNQQYGNNNQQYGNNPQYSNPPRYNNNNSNPYGTNRQYDNNQSNNNQQYGNNPQYGNNRQYGNNQQYGNDNRQFDGNRQYDSNQQGDNNRQFDNNQQFGNGQQYGNNYDNNNSNGQDNCCEDYCYTGDSEPYINFATKTAYETLDRRSGLQHNIPDCTPVQFWSLNRHGSRLPGRRQIESLRKLTRIQEEIIKNHEERRSYPDKGRICARDYDLLKRWRWNDTITEARAKSLTSEGINELKLLSRRYKSKFPTIFNEPYSERSYYFQYTDSDRTHDSYQAYIEGLFGSEAYRVHANSYPDDRLIKSYKNCRAWENQVDDNPRTYDEYKIYTQRPEYQEMVRNVFKRLGFRYTLNASIIDDMYDMCRYEKAWYVQRPSPWCVAFTKDQLKQLEYGEDLISYYKEGYGNELNKKIGCPPLKDMYERFEKTVNGETEGNKATFYFTHSQTIASTLAAMGIAKDYTPLKADNYYQQARRQWKQSTILPFAANLVSVLYQCRSNDRYKVMFFLNEQPVEFPECQVGLCSWDTVQQKFKYTAENCNLDFCDGNSASTTYNSNLTYLLVAIGYLLFSRL